MYGSHIGQNVLLCKPNRTKYIPFIPVRPRMLGVDSMQDAANGLFSWFASLG
jgi:hypothetical protein